MRIKSTLLFLMAAMLFQCKPVKLHTINLEASPDSIELFAPDIISTAMFERDIAISPDGEEIIYTLGDFRQIRRCLVIMRKSGNKWSGKEILSFSGQYDDLEPCFSTDGSKLYFASNRPVEGDTLRNDYNIWVTERLADSWGEAVPLPEVINSTGDEFYPSVSAKGNIYYTAVRSNGIGSEDIFLSRYVNGKYLEPEPLDSSINSPTYEFNAYIDPDEKVIIFSSFGRSDDLGGGDLYYSVKDSNGLWKPAVNPGPVINSTNLDFCPFVDVSRGNFYFTSDRTGFSKSRFESVTELEEFANRTLNGTGNIYRIQYDKIMTMPQYLK